MGADTPVRMSAKHEGYLAGGIGDGDKSVLAPNVGAPLASGYTLTGIQLIDGNTLVRARGFARSGHQNGSESIEDKVQSVFRMGCTRRKCISLGPCFNAKRQRRPQCHRHADR